MLSKFIQKKLREFDKTIGGSGFFQDALGINNYEDIKSFISSAIKEVCKEFAEEIRLEKESFEDFLMEKHAEQAEGVLDDDMPDDFENWLIDLEIDDVMKYADEYINQAKVKLDKKISNFIK